MLTVRTHDISAQIKYNHHSCLRKESDDGKNINKSRQKNSLASGTNGHPVHRNGIRTSQSDLLKREGAPDDGRYVSLEEYWETWYDHGDASYEWNNGRLEAKPLTTPTQYSLYVWFLMLLIQYAKSNSDVDIMGLETGFTMNNIPNPDLPGTFKDVVRNRILQRFVTITQCSGGKTIDPIRASATSASSHCLIPTHTKSYVTSRQNMTSMSSLGCKSIIFLILAASTCISMSEQQQVFM